MDASLITSSGIAAFVQILLIDVVLAGDNAIVVGALAAGLPPQQRRKAVSNTHMTLPTNLRE